MSMPVSVRVLAERLNPIDARRAPPHLQESAVLVLLFAHDGQPYFVLTQRPSSMSRHPGQVSLPGGVRETGDRTLWETALRETREELGVRTGRLQPMGALEPVEVLGEHFVFPFVAWSPLVPRLRPAPAEVESVLEVPLADLHRAENVAEEIWFLHGRRWTVTYYRFGEMIVWGATARILSDLADRLDEAPLPRRPAPGSVLPI